MGSTQCWKGPAKWRLKIFFLNSNNKIAQQKINLIENNNDLDAEAADGDVN